MVLLYFMDPSSSSEFVFDTLWMIKIPKKIKGFSLIQNFLYIYI